MVAPMGHDRFDGCPYNQWIYRGPTLGLGDPLYRPFREILAEPHQRDRWPLLRLDHHDFNPQPWPAWTPEKDTERHAAS
jgi:hypothetical protein